MSNKEARNLFTAGAAIATAAAIAVGASRETKPSSVPGTKLVNEVEDGQLQTQPSGELVALFPGVRLRKTPVIPNADLGQEDNTSMVVPEGNILIAKNPSELTTKDGKVWLLIDIADKDDKIIKSFAAQTDLIAEQAGSNQPLIAAFLLDNPNQPNTSEMIKPDQLNATTVGLPEFNQQ